MDRKKKTCYCSCFQIWHRSPSCRRKPAGARDLEPLVPCASPHGHGAQLGLDSRPHSALCCMTLGSSDVNRIKLRPREAE